MGRAGLTLTIGAAALLAGTSLVHAIDPHASAALQKANQKAADEAQEVEERIARMEGEIARMNEEFRVMREQKIQVQDELQELDAKKSK
jgi:TolA-binding protein